MASGYGVTGGVSRCFPFWQEYMSCYVMSREDTEARSKGICAPRLEDYYECLHHKKEYARAQAIQDALRKAEAATPRENAPKAGQIRSLGLIGKEEGHKVGAGCIMTAVWFWDTGMVWWTELCTYGEVLNHGNEQA